MLRRKFCTGKQGCGLCGGTRGQKGLEPIQIPESERNCFRLLSGVGRISRAPQGLGAARLCGQSSGTTAYTAFHGKPLARAAVATGTLTSTI